MSAPNPYAPPLGVFALCHRTITALLVFAAASGCSGGQSTPGQPTAGDASAEGSAAMSSDGGPPGSPSDATLLNLGPDDAALSPDAIPTFMDPYGGAAGCHGDAGVFAGCGLMMPLTGGLSTTLYAAASGACRWGVAGFGTDVGMTAVLIRVDTPLAPGHTGQVTASIYIQTSTAADAAVVEEWVTNPGACTLDLTSNTCVSDRALHAPYGLAGTGTCSSAALPLAATTTPVQIGAFYFEGVADQGD